MTVESARLHLSIPTPIYAALERGCKNFHLWSLACTFEVEYKAQEGKLLLRRGSEKERARKRMEDEENKSLCPMGYTGCWEHDRRRGEPREDEEGDGCW